MLHDATVYAIGFIVGEIAGRWPQIRIKLRARRRLQRLRAWQEWNSRTNLLRGQGAPYRAARTHHTGPK
jgi:hypothetical protein